MTSARPLYILLGVAIFFSIANLVLFIFLFQIRQQVVGAAAQAAQVVQQLRAEPLAPFTTNVSIDQTIAVPIDTSIQVQTTVNVPVTIPIIGQRVEVTVPIDTTVPIHTTVQVPIKQSIPIEISVRDLPIGSTLQQIQDWLTKLATGI
jgi:hypothetical protein